MAEVIAQDSSFIAETRYYHNAEDEFEAGDLVVEFTDGAEWVYHGVTHTAYTAFITAPSRGRAFHQLIKERFEGEPA